MSTARRLAPASKTQTLCRDLRALAYELGAGEKFPTAIELCERFQTSRATLNDALDILEDQGILSRRRGSGIYVSTRLHTKCIYVLLYAYLFLGENKSPFWGMFSGLLAEEMERRTLNNAYQCELHFVLQSDRDKLALPQSVVEMIESGRVDGILTVGMNNITTAWIEQQGVPCVVYAGYGPYTVTQDLDTLVRQAVTLLASKGCQRIGFWTESTYYETERELSSDRLIEQSFIQALKEYSLPLYPELIHYKTMRRATLQGPVPTYQQQGYQYVMEIFGNKNHPQPDGLFIDNDMITSGALAAFQRLGIHPGEELCIVTQTNTGSPILFGYEDELSRVEFDPAELVHEMFAMLDILLQPERPETLHFQILPRNHS
ncbi:GntR family transcriptional regulator [Tengunoibacter tsumagoiensis]|uniref:HTH gntR-type domain-containing protein n=1 Tax=Tengunoibacter tsumagoiensis TaxID=2014871 RepID=A0A402A6W1_9CHLR|nr:substrate-binding domain-containing protein [Tengunoibacter tsumagoiensis]GCE14765.1 hypothetical protein KTT_46240 [Tengunoibacter tsumagoiensis]